jgi:hypothetical protein
VPSLNPSVPSSTAPPESPVEEVIEDVEDLFMPRAGGIVDRHRQERARRAAAEADAQNRAEKIERPSFRSVKVAQTSPEVINPQTVTVPAGGVAMVLPNSPYRYKAVLLVSTTATSVLLAKDQSNALGGVGFTLPSGVPLTLDTRAQLWAYNVSGSAVAVSVIAMIYGPETVS